MHIDSSYEQDAYNSGNSIQKKIVWNFRSLATLTLQASSPEINLQTYLFCLTWSSRGSMQIDLLEQEEQEPFQSTHSFST